MFSEHLVNKEIMYYRVNLHISSQAQKASRTTTTYRTMLTLTDTHAVRSRRDTDIAHCIQHGANIPDSIFTGDVNIQSDTPTDDHRG